MRNTPVRRAYSRNHSGSRTQVRNDAGAANVAMPRTRSSPAAVTIASVPPRRKPAIHTPVTSPRASSASTAARTSASQPSIEKSPSDGPVPRKVNVSPAQPASRATRSHKRRVGVAERGRAARTARESRQHEQRGTRVRRRAGARNARSAAALPRRSLPRPELPPAFERRRRYPDPRELPDAITHRPTPHPRLKEWAAIVHALLEGEQIIDLRKGGFREDGRHFDLPAAPPVALPDRRAPDAPSCSSPRTGTGSISRPPRPSASAITIVRLGRRHRRRDDHRGRAPRRDRLEADLDRRLRVVATQVEEARPAVGARAARPPSRRADHGPWDEAYGGCTSWVTLGGLPADPATAAFASGALRRRVRVEAARACSSHSPPSAGSSSAAATARAGAARCAAAPSR